MPRKRKSSFHEYVHERTPIVKVHGINSFVTKIVPKHKSNSISLSH